METTGFNVQNLRYHGAMPTLSPTQEKPLRQLLSVFLAENRNLNLTALRTEEACWHGNIRDSLPLLDLFAPEGPLPVPRTLLDVGTGGGFPLLPLAMLLPQAQCSGLDATGKKIEAIRRIVRALNLSNIDFVTARAEEAGRDARLRERFDLVTARAVAALPILLEYCAPFAKVGGHVVLWKSMHIEEELAASKHAQEVLHCPLLFTHAYDLGGEWGVRQLLVFTKTGPTPSRYPRAVGEAKKEPL